MNSLLKIQVAIGVCLWGLSVAPGLAQGYPARPIRIITGNPGATADILTRQIGRRLTDRWGKQIVVDNRGGAGGTIAAEITANAAPDGYTLLMGQLNSHALAVNLHKKLSYDALHDFSPISFIASAPQVLVVNRSFPADNWSQFAQFIRQHPGKFNYASSGYGAGSHLTSELLKQIAKLDIAHINYKGGAAATFAITSGEASAGFVLLSTAMTALQSGKIKPLAISSMQRFPTLPNVPTFHESGLAKFEASSWFGMFGPASTTRTLVGLLNREIVDILRTAAVQQDLLKLGAVATPSTPEEFGAFVKSEILKWREVIYLAGIQKQ